MPILLTDELDCLFEEAVTRGVFPGGVFGVSCGNPAARQTVIKAYGRLWVAGLGPPNNPPMTADVVFDLASLTKPLATVLGLLCLKRRGVLSLTDCLPDLLGRVVPRDKSTITLAQLLQHSSGLPAHRPYFESLRTLPAEARKEAVLAMILAEPLATRPGENVVYSDLGYILLGHIIEEKSKQSLDRFVAQWVYAPLGLEGRIAFNPSVAPMFLAGVSFAPTEDCPWRRRVLQGEVHDDNAHALGGVAGQAGLFGSTPAVLILSRFLLDLIKGRTRHPYLEASDLLEAVSRCGPPGSTWGLGFDTPSAKQSSAGNLLSRLSFGHLGYTGTSFWCDPERDLAVVLLTNRVHPSRENTLIRDFRPRFHDAVARCCDASLAAIAP